MQRYPEKRTITANRADCPACFPPLFPKSASPAHSEECIKHPNNLISQAAPFPMPMPMPEPEPESELEIPPQRFENIPAVVIFFDQLCVLTANLVWQLSEKELPRLVDILRHEASINNANLVHLAWFTTDLQHRRGYDVELKKLAIEVVNTPPKGFSLQEIIENEKIFSGGKVFKDNDKVLVISVQSGIARKFLCTTLANGKKEIVPKETVTLSEVGENKSVQEIPLNSELFVGMSASIIFFDMPHVRQCPDILPCLDDGQKRLKFPSVMHALISDIRENNLVVSISNNIMYSDPSIVSKKELISEIRNQNVLLEIHKDEKLPSLESIIDSNSTLLKLLRRGLDQKKLLVEVRGATVTKYMYQWSPDGSHSLSRLSSFEINEEFLKRMSFSRKIHLDIFSNTTWQSNLTAEEVDYIKTYLSYVKGASLPLLTDEKVDYINQCIDKYRLNPIDSLVRQGDEPLARNLAKQLKRLLTPYQEHLLKNSKKNMMLLIDWQNIHVAAKDTLLLIEATKEFLNAYEPDKTVDITVFLDRRRVPHITEVLTQNGCMVKHIDGSKSGAADALLIDTLRDNSDNFSSIAIVSGDRDFSAHLAHYSHMGHPAYLVYNEQAWFTFKTNPQWVASIDYLDLPVLAELKNEKQQRQQSQPHSSHKVHAATKIRSSKPCQFFQSSTCKHQANESACSFKHVCKRCFNTGAENEAHAEKTCYRPEVGAFQLVIPYIDFNWSGWKAIRAFLASETLAEQKAALQKSGQPPLEELVFNEKVIAKYQMAVNKEKEAWLELSNSRRALLSAHPRLDLATREFNQALTEQAEALGQGIPIFMEQERVISILERARALFYHPASAQAYDKSKLFLKNEDITLIHLRELEVLIKELAGAAFDRMLLGGGLSQKIKPLALRYQQSLSDDFFQTQKNKIIQDSPPIKVLGLGVLFTLYAYASYRIGNKFYARFAIQMASELLNDDSSVFCTPSQSDGTAEFGQKALLKNYDMTVLRFQVLYNLGIICADEVNLLPIGYDKSVRMEAHNKSHLLVKGIKEQLSAQMMGLVASAENFQRETPAWRTSWEEIEYAATHFNSLIAAENLPRLEANLRRSFNQLMQHIRSISSSMHEPEAFPSSVGMPNSNSVFGSSSLSPSLRIQLPSGPIPQTSMPPIHYQASATCLFPMTAVPSMAPSLPPSTMQFPSGPSPQTSTVAIPLSAAEVPICSMCNSRARYVEKGKLQPFCSRNCNRIFAANNPMCLCCQKVPRYTSERKTYLFCTTTCAHVYAHPENTSFVDINASYTPTLTPTVSSFSLFQPPPPPLPALPLASSNLSEALSATTLETLPLKTLTVAQLAHWISEKGDFIKKYSAHFEKECIDGTIFSCMTDEELKEIGIESSLARRMLLRFREAFPKEPSNIPALP